MHGLQSWCCIEIQNNETWETSTDDPQKGESDEHEIFPKPSIDDTLTCKAEEHPETQHIAANTETEATVYARPVSPGGVPGWVSPPGFWDTKFGAAYTTEKTEIQSGEKFTSWDKADVDGTHLAEAEALKEKIKADEEAERALKKKKEEDEIAEKALKKKKEEDKKVEKILKEVEALVGCDKIKSQFKKIKVRVDTAKQQGEEIARDQLNIALRGNPGTGNVPFPSKIWKG